MLSTVKQFTNTHANHIVIVAAALFAVVFSALGVWKYIHFGYSGLDLGIINHVFANTLRGDILASFIHPPSYLGDHVTPILFLLLPIYAVAAHPISLIILQTVAIAAAAWPLYRISQRFFTDQPWSIVAPIIFLLHISLHYMAMFEFHFLPLVLPLFFTAFLFYQRRRFIPFIALISLLVLVREDVTLLLLGFSLFIAVDQGRQWLQQWRWWLVPAALAVTWLAIAITISSAFNPTGSYKFLIYYGWLGDSLPGLIVGIFQQPLETLRMLLRLQNWQMLIGLLMPFAFLPVFKPKYWLIALPIIFQYALSSSGGSGVVVTTHYAAPIVAAFTLATIATVHGWYQQPRWGLPKGVIVVLLLVSSLWSIGTIGVRPSRASDTVVADYQQALALVPEDGTVVSGQSLLPHLSQRPQVALLNYIFTGRQQFAATPYTLDTVDALIFDSDTFVNFQLVYESRSRYQPLYVDGAQRLRQLITDHDLQLAGHFGQTLVWRRDVTEPLPLPATVVAAPPTNYFDCRPLPNNRFTCDIQFNQSPDRDYQLLVQQRRGQTVLTETPRALAHGLYLSNELTPSQRLRVVHHITPDAQTTNICIQLVHLQGSQVLDRFSQITPQIRQKNVIQSSCWSIEQGIDQAIDN